MPDLSLVARYEKIGTGPDFSDTADWEEEVWFVGLSGDTDLLRRSERIALGQAVLDEKTAGKRVEILESSLRRQIQQAILSYERARKQVSFAERNYRLARDRANLAQRLFEMGRSDNFTVTDAETEWLEAETQKLSSKAESSIAAYKLLRILGTLIESPEDLKRERI